MGAGCDVPLGPGDPERIHWSFPDPAAVEGSEDAQQRAFDRTASDIAAGIRIWLSLLASGSILNDLRPFRGRSVFVVRREK